MAESSVYLSFVDRNDGTYYIIIEGEPAEQITEDREVKLPRRFDCNARDRLMRVMQYVISLVQNGNANRITVDTELEHALNTQNMGFDTLAQELRTF